MTTLPRYFRAIITTALLLGLSACDDADNKAADAPKTEPPMVSVAGVNSKEIVRTSEFIGAVEAVNDVDLIARVEGFLQETLIEDGAQVSAGDVLFRIEAEKFAAAKAGALADLAQAEANLALAAIDLERDTKLLASKTIAQSKFDATKAANDSPSNTIRSPGPNVKARSPISVA